MPNDDASSKSIAVSVRKLTAAGVITADIQCNSFPLYESYFTERIPGMDANTSAKIFEALRDQKYLNSSGFIVRPDPDAADWDFYTDWDWADLVRKLRVLDDEGSRKWGAAVEEEISLAYAFHCPTSLRSSEMLDWLDGNVYWSSSMLISTT